MVLYSNCQGSGMRWTYRDILYGLVVHLLTECSWRESMGVGVVT